MVERRQTPNLFLVGFEEFIAGRFLFVCVFVCFKFLSETIRLHWLQGCGCGVSKLRISGHGGTHLGLANQKPPQNVQLESFHGNEPHLANAGLSTVKSFPACFCISQPTAPAPEPLWLGDPNLLEHFCAHRNTVEFFLPKLFLLQEI